MRFRIIHLLILTSFILFSWPVAGVTSEADLSSISIAYDGTPATNFYNSVLEEGGFYPKNNLNVTPRYFDTAREAGEAAIRGDTDFAIVNSYAVASLIHNGEKPVILSSVLRVDDVYYIVVNTKAGIISPADLNGKRIGLVTEDFWEYYLNKYALLNGIDVSSFTLIPLTADEIGQKLKNGEIDAGLLLYQVASAICSPDPSQYQMWSVNNHENFYLVLICNREVAETHPETVVRLIRALSGTGDWYSGNIGLAEDTIAKKSGVPAEQVHNLISGLSPEVSLTQGLLNTLESQSRYLQEESPNETGVDPDYLRIIDFSFLDQVNPKGDTIIHE